MSRSVCGHCHAETWPISMADSDDRLCSRCLGRLDMPVAQTTVVMDIRPTFKGTTTPAVCGLLNEHGEPCQMPIGAEYEALSKDGDITCRGCKRVRACCFATQPAHFRLQTPGGRSHIETATFTTLTLTKNKSPTPPPLPVPAAPPAAYAAPAAPPAEAAPAEAAPPAAAPAPAAPLVPKRRKRKASVSSVLPERKVPAKPVPLVAPSAVLTQPMATTPTRDDSNMDQTFTAMQAIDVHHRLASPHLKRAQELWRACGFPRAKQSTTVTSRCYVVLYLALCDMQMALPFEHYKQCYVPEAQRADCDNQWKRIYRVLHLNGQLPMFDIQSLCWTLMQTLVNDFVDTEHRDLIRAQAKQWHQRMVSSSYFDSGLLHSEKSRAKRQQQQQQHKKDKEAEPSPRHRHQNMTYFTFPWVLRALAVLHILLRDDKFGGLPLVKNLCKYCGVKTYAVRKERNNLLKHCGTVKSSSPLSVVENESSSSSSSTIADTAAAAAAAAATDRIDRLLAAFAST